MIQIFERGHAVTVITTVPNFPEGRLFENREELDAMAKASLAAAPGHSRQKQAQSMLEIFERVNTA
jgi:hypothetical protein